MKKGTAFVLSFVLICLILGGAFVVSASERVTIEDIENLLNSYDRVPGEFSVVFADGVSEEDAKKILVDIGLPNDFNNKDVYMSNGFNKNYKDNFIDVRVNDDIIAEIILALCHHEGVYCVIPNWISKADDKVNVGDLNGDNNIDAFDYMLLKSAILGSYELSNDQRVLADVNCDGLVNAFDYQLLKYIVLH